MGSGGHAVSVADVARSAGFEVVGFTSDSDAGRELQGVPILSVIPDAHVASGGAVTIAVGDNFRRQHEWEKLTEKGPTLYFPALCHERAVVASDVQLSPASVVMQGAIVVSGAVVGTGAVMNTGSILDHESSLADFASLAPGAVVGGRVKIGARTAVSIGAVVRHGLSIGRDTVLGAACYADKDLPNQVVAYGVPARVQRSREPGDPYLA